MDLLAQAIEANNAGRVADAVAFAEAALEADPSNVEALILSGVSQAKISHLDGARTRLEEALARDPKSFLAAYWLSGIFRKRGETSAALDYARLAVDIAPDQPAAHERLGHCYLDAFRFKDAEACFRAALARLPKSAPLAGSLGLALRGQGRTAEALDAFQKAVDIDPSSFTSLMLLVTALNEDQQAETAVTYARTALVLRPDSPDAYLALSNTLIAAQKVSAAEVVLAQAEPTANILVSSGQVKQLLGKAEEARLEFEKALQLDPSQSEAYLGLIGSRRMTLADVDLIARAEATLKSEPIAQAARMNLNYALGKANEDLGHYEEAMRHFDEANIAARLIRFGDTPFDPQLQTADNDFAIDLFKADFLAQNQGQGSPSELPIFVVGMIRSGTTLVQQILSSHPEIGAAGERNFWLSAKSRTIQPDKAKWVPGKLRELAEEYCGILKSLSPGKRYVIDKMPGNYAVMPLIHLALPNARFIHVRRHPIDTCLSIYTTPNAARIDWAHDKANIVFAYEEYLRLMDAWRKVVPPGRLLEIEYEDLVANQEQVTRRMVAFCGLEWDESCLRPHEKQGVVTTPSVLQVRQPVHRGSVERWKRYEPWLGAFLMLNRLAI